MGEVKVIDDKLTKSEPSEVVKYDNSCCTNSTLGDDLKNNLNETQQKVLVNNFMQGIKGGKEYTQEEINAIGGLIPMKDEIPFFQIEFEDGTSMQYDRNIVKTPRGDDDIHHIIQYAIKTAEEPQQAKDIIIKAINKGMNDEIEDAILTQKGPKNEPLTYTWFDANKKELVYVKFFKEKVTQDHFKEIKEMEGGKGATAKLIKED